MNAFIIEDNRTFADKISVNFKLNKNFINEAIDIKDIYSKVVGTIKEEDIIFINCELVVIAHKRQELFGIQVLKWLRLKGLKNHCVLYSFLSREQIMLLSPENLIVFSEGITFLQLPYDFTNFEVYKLVQKKAPMDLKEYFKIGFSTPEENRHDWANWWGIERLWQIHEVVIQKKKEDISEYTNSKFYTKMQSLESQIARYLYPINFNKVREAEDKIAIDNYKNQMLLKRNLLRSNRLNNEEKVKYHQEILQLEQKINDVSERKNISDLIGQIRSKIINNNRKIVLIDDQADDGWEVVFKNVLYNDNNTLFSNLIAPTVDEMNTCLQSINDSTDIVLLDLRLKKESGTIHDITELSGAKLLKKIKKRHPGIPVIMITASNKFRSYQTLLDLGADGFWMKEGLDSRFNEKESLENYLQLLKLIEKLSGKEYRLLKHIATQIKIIKNKSHPWWENHAWSDNGKTEIQIIHDDEGEFISSVTNLLDYGLMLYTNWLKMFILTENKKTSNTDVYKENLLANIINTLGKIVELIHYNLKNDDRIPLNRSEISGLFQTKSNNKRSDYLAFFIYTIRNLGSHISETSTINYEIFELYIKLLLSWLASDNYISIDSNDIGITTKDELIKIVNKTESFIKNCTNMILKTKEQQIKKNYKYKQYAAIFNSFNK